MYTFPRVEVNFNKETDCSKVYFRKVILYVTRMFRRSAVKYFAIRRGPLRRKAPFPSYVYRSQLQGTPHHRSGVDPPSELYLDGPVILKIPSQSVTSPKRQCIGYSPRIHYGAFLLGSNVVKGPRPRRCPPLDHKAISRGKY